MTFEHTSLHTSLHDKGMHELGFPGRYARTQRFTLGEPRDVSVSADGDRVVFLRTRSGDDTVNCLWVHRPDNGIERVVADPVRLLQDGPVGEESEAEVRRRDRMRESAGGIVSYAGDRKLEQATFALAGRLFVADLIRGATRELAVGGHCFDPRFAPAGDHIAYLDGPTLRACDLEGRSWELAGDDDPNVTWGSAEFIAAEEMQRQRGFWWSPDGRRLAVCRVDVSPVHVWHLADPSRPGTAPRAIRYPAAGTPNATVTLHVLGLLDDHVVQADYDFTAWPYLVAVEWADVDRLLAVVQTRDQRRVRVIEIDVRTGHTVDRASDLDDHWVEIVKGVPGELDDGRLVMCADRGGARRLMVDGVAVTLPDQQVRSVLRIGGDHVLFTANDMEAPENLHVWRWNADGTLDRLSSGTGVHWRTGDGPTHVTRSSNLERPGTVTFVHSGRPDGPREVTSIADDPVLRPAPVFARVTDDRIPTALLLPTRHDGGPLPVLLDPYGGPHAQRVVAAQHAYLVPQWFADQGFAVVIIDGRGTPGRGSAWERAVHRDLAGPVLDDQMRALEAISREHPELDLDRVAIRGWSFGGYLAALAALRRPDVVKAAVAGAPVTDWRLYDTHYTERYLGDPTVDAEPYERTSLGRAAREHPRHLGPRRPILLVHGLADDNVVAAHTLTLSAELLAAGHPHEVLPLPAMSHHLTSDVVAEQLLLHQLRFIRRTLGVNGPGDVR
jgi:dipeptidyl-peptidase 4